MTLTLATFWSGIIAMGIIIYVILDGFDLGIGMISVLFRSEHDRDLMISSILPYWDGNETWLVFGAAALYGAFPSAFSQLLPALYIPLMIMVVGLLFRGVAFEFRLKATRSKKTWDYALFFGSLIATLMQGCILGTFVSGLNPAVTRGNLHVYQWLNPFGLFCAVALIFGYVQLGANFLIAKTTGHIRTQCYKIASHTQYILALATIIASIWSPFLHHDIYERWFNPSYMPYLAMLPITCGMFWLLHFKFIKEKMDAAPFWMTVGLFITCYAGFIVSCYPYIVPRHLPFWEGTASVESLIFMTIGAVIMLPLLLFYTGYAYYIFRGKITEKIQY